MERSEALMGKVNSGRGRYSLLLQPGVHRPRRAYSAVFANGLPLEGGTRTVVGQEHRGKQYFDTEFSVDPLITVITVVFNGAAGLEATIQSVISQDRSRIAYIILDGGSTDGTLEIIRKYSHELDYWRSQPDRGIYDAFNSGVKLATGKWVLFLGSGDVLSSPKSLSDVVPALQSARDDVQVAYGRVSIMDIHGSIIEEENEAWSVMRNKWIAGRKTMPHHQGTFQRRCFLLTHPFDVSYRTASDYKVFVLATRRCEPLYIDHLVARVSAGGVSSVPHRSLSGAIEILKLNREMGLGFDHFPHQLFFFCKSFVKSTLSVLLPVGLTMRIIDLYRRMTGRLKKWT